MVMVTACKYFETAKELDDYVKENGISTYATQIVKGLGTEVYKLSFHVQRCESCED